MNFKSFNFIILVLSLVFLAGCTKKESEPLEVNQLPNPEAGFSFKQVSEDDPFTFQFVNESAKYKDTRWSFGDDSTSVQNSPIHTFLKTGKFNVKLLVLNENGDWAQKEIPIVIDAEKLVTFKATSIGVGKLKLGYEADLAINKVSWHKGTDGGVSLSNEAIATIDLPVGSFAEYSLVLFTPKGSRISITKNLTDLGIVVDWTNIDNTFSVSQENSGGADASEGSKKLINNNLKDKFLVFDYKQGMFWQFAFYAPKIVNAYTITTGNDAPSRDPKNWKFQGSDDETNWVDLDVHTDYSFGEGRNKSSTFTFFNPKKYFYYRFVLDAVGSGSLFQMSEFRCLELPQ